MQQPRVFAEVLLYLSNTPKIRQSKADYALRQHNPRYMVLPVTISWTL
jgi:hypothetical protein